MEFANQIVVVTGGGSGIGADVALAFGRRGAHVVLTYLGSADGAKDVADGIRAAGGHATALRADLTVEASVVEVMRTAASLGRIDAVVANAGGLIGRLPCVETDLKFWRDAMALNLDSVFLCCREALRYMTRAGSGKIVLVSSLAGHDGGGPGASHYAAAKGAVLSYTRALAKEVGPSGIRVNAVAPGLIATRFHDQFNTPEARAATVSRTPLRREGRASDVASAVLFLASDDADFVTGEVLEVNGGLGMY